MRREIEALAQALRRDGADGPPDAFVAMAPPAVKVVRCGLARQRGAERYVAPRVTEFARRFPKVRTCRELLALIDEHASPEAFAAETLDCHDKPRARLVRALAEYLVDVQERFEGDDEAARLAAWAAWARPGDSLAAGVPGLGLAGFQALRLAFGARAALPDAQRYVARVLGRRVPVIEALSLLEQAAEYADVSLRGLEHAGPRPHPSVV